MNKELTPLEALNSLVGMAVVQQRAYTIKPIIEKALKAFEIIKKKEVNIPDLLDCIRNEKGDYIEDALKQYNVFQSTRWQLTQEEYDLLKEVLL